MPPVWIASDGISISDLLIGGVSNIVSIAARGCPETEVILTSARGADRRRYLV